MRRSLPLTVVSLNEQGEVDEESREIEAEMFVMEVAKDKSNATFVYMFQDGDNVLIHGHELALDGAANIFSRGHGFICAAAEAVGLKVGIRKEGGTVAFPGPVASTALAILMKVADTSAAPWLSWE